MAHTILIADDDADICNLLQYTLENAGYKAHICPNGRDVINKLRIMKPAALILDVMLPGMDGAAIARKMNEDAELSQIPIIVESALEASRKLFQTLPQVSKFITKPFDPEQLLEDLNEALSAK